jgi:hypothetical protein
MPDNYVRGSETFRAKETGGIKSPVLLAGAHIRTYKGVESLVVTDTSLHNLTVPAGATHADIVMEAAADTDFVRFWHGASNPTASVGVMLYNREAVATADPASFSVIKGSSGAGGTLRVEYYAYE